MRTVPAVATETDGHLWNIIVHSSISSLGVAQSLVKTMSVAGGTVGGDIGD